MARHRVTAGATPLKPIKVRSRIVARNARATTARLVSGGLAVDCALGRTGIRARKREGDGATPRGRFELVEVRYRPDRLARPETRLPVRPIAPRDGWCDAIGDPNYNRPVRHPYPSSAEQMWRDDGLYDVVIVTSHNRRPRVQGAGSAIFIHIARAGFEPTAGCVALERRALLRLIARLGPGATIDIGTTPVPVRGTSRPVPDR